MELSPLMVGKTGSKCPSGSNMPTSSPHGRDD